LKKQTIRISNYYLC